jgi:hypothetical protein
MRLSMLMQRYEFLSKSQPILPAMSTDTAVDADAKI